MQKTSLLLGFIFFCFTLIAKPSVQKNKLDGIYTFKDNFCSASLLFKPTGEFYYEGGCEERSNIAKGNYKIDGNKITLLTMAAPIQYSITKENTNKSNKIQITLTDADGKPLPYTKILTLPYKMNNDTLNAMNYLETDSMGQLILNTSKISAISLDRYNPSKRFMHKDQVYHWENVSNFNSDKLTIKFNYPIFCLRYPEIGVTGSVPELQLANNETKLVDKQNNIYIKSEK